MTYVFDIDGTICHTEGSDYENSQPMKDRIAVINKLYKEGNTVFFLTARGMGRTDNDQEKANELLYEFTKEQLQGWDVKFHKLFLGKPNGAIYIDDKALLDVDFFTQMQAKMSRMF